MARAGLKMARWAVGLAWSLSGCGGFPAPPAPLFSVPLEVEDTEVAPAILDTGGDYEILLQDPFGLAVVGQIEVLAFGGRELVEMTEGFTYSAGGFETTAPFALVGLSVCDCNGLGFRFFQKTGVVLGLDFPNRRASFLAKAPTEGLLIPFGMPPAHLYGFRTSFILVRIGLGLDVPPEGAALPVVALLDTGSNITAVQRSLFGLRVKPGQDRIDMTIDHSELGTLAANVEVFETRGLPDLILGTDAMRAWASDWVFSFTAEGGAVTVRTDSMGASLESKSFSLNLASESASATLPSGPRIE
jgi:hypothetical protein